MSTPASESSIPSFDKWWAGRGAERKGLARQAYEAACRDTLQFIEAKEGVINLLISGKASAETRSGELEGLLRRALPHICCTMECSMSGVECTCDRDKLLAEIQAALGQGK